MSVVIFHEDVSVAVAYLALTAVMKVVTGSPAGRTVDFFMAFAYRAGDSQIQFSGHFLLLYNWDVYIPLICVVVRAPHAVCIYCIMLFYDYFEGEHFFLRSVALSGYFPGIPPGAYGSVCIQFPDPRRMGCMHKYAGSVCIVLS